VPLEPGRRIGTYEVTALLGVGGMGEVYRARDTKLGRDVAVKVLLTSVAGDADRVARFSREAQLLASLNHPNIAHIHGFEESAGTTALVMELVDGPTLADRIVRGPVPLDEALRIAAQIAAALEAAHDHGIIHRDLKPANIKVRPDGTVKVLDFGLSKAVDPAGQSGLAATMSPTLSVHATLAGVILGTAAYMSPEQASGKPVDKRSDLWAFGVVLFEMLTGHQVFTGDTTSHVLASVLKSDPDWTALPANTPTAARRLLRRCLEKDRKRRLADASDARLEIEDALSSDHDDVSRYAAGEERATRRWALASGWVVAVAMLAVVGAAKWRDTSSSSAAVLALPVYSSLDVPADSVLGEDDSLVSLPIHTPMVFTPDGRSIIIQAARARKPQLFLRSLDRPDARPIAGTEDARVPFVSPDGKWVGFFAANEIRKVPIDGGEAATICSLAGSLGPNGATWGTGDVILFASDADRQIMRVSAAGGVATPVTQQASRLRRHVTPYWLPDGKRFLFADISSVDANDARLMVQDLGGGEPRLVVDSATDGRLLPSGQLAFMRLGTLMIAKFDATRAAIEGVPVVAMRNVMQGGLRVRGGANNTGAGVFAVSSSGALAVVRGGLTGGENTQLIWVTLSGRVTSAEPSSGAPIGGRLVPRISPDHSRAMMTVITSTRWEVWFADWARDIWTVCADCKGDMAFLPHAWSPDGRRLMLTTNPETIVAHTIDGSAPDQVLVREPKRVIQPVEWLTDGRLVYLSAANEEPTSDIMVKDVGAAAGHVIASGSGPTVSPDARWLAYNSLQTENQNVILQAFPGPGTRTQVSAGGGFDPAWSPDGRALYYLKTVPDSRETALMSVDISAKDGVSASAPRELFRRSRIVNCSSIRCYDIVMTANGVRFLMRDESSRQHDTVTRMDLVQNWVSTLPRN
jgi:serine/threonine protein kinase/Tol biopolymer transport system component